MPLLDTTVFIDLMRTRNKNRHQEVIEALARFTSAQDRPRTIRFSVAELLVGVERCDDQAAQRRKVEAVLAGILILEFDEEAMKIYPKIDAHFLNIGRPVGVMDMLIASVALASRQVLLTRNLQHFQDISGFTLATY